AMPTRVDNPGVQESRFGSLRRLSQDADVKPASTEDGRMKLYIHPISLANRPARLFIAEHNIRVDEQDVDVLKSEHFQPPSATVNPNGQVLVLEGNGLRIIENSAILKYLANKVNSPAWSKDLKRRRRRRLWTRSTPSTIASKVTASSIHRFPEQQVPERRGAASPPRLKKHAEIDKELAVCCA
ncbi:MAG: hypothetical protein M3120_04175, partial [Pseudomonadota bacterium]|nr:hypothetical protein [Pseudomonadota bacterium]